MLKNVYYDHMTIIVTSLLSSLPLWFNDSYVVMIMVLFAAGVNSRRDDQEMDTTFGRVW